MALDHKQAAREILEAVGGASNVVSAAHCATRLRLVIADDSKVDQKKVDNAVGAKGNFKASGQLQVIYGTGTVNKVYDEFVAQGHITGATKAEAKEAAADQQKNPFMRAIKLLGDIFVPIIPAIVASGLLLGIMSALGFMNSNGFITLDTSSALYQITDFVSSTAFTFLQILIAFSAAKAFGANPYLGAAVGMFLIHPSLQNAYTLASDGVTNTASLFGWTVDLVGYQGHVIPIIIAVWLLSVLEKKLHKVVPDMLDLFVTPLVSVWVTCFVTISFIGPIFIGLENGILGAIQFLLTLPLGIGALVVGGLYAPTVVTGLHQMYTAIDLGQLAQYGVTYWLPIASAANIAQGGACLAVALKTKDEKIKGLAAPSALSAFMGITEPAIFGVNLRFFKPFIAGCIGGAVGAWICAMTNLAATGTGVTGIFGILLCLSQPVQYVIMFAVTAAVAFAISFVLYKDGDGSEVAAADTSKVVAEAQATANQSAAVAEAVNDAAPVAIASESIAAPMTGAAIAMSEVPDPVFASEAMGKGAAVVPTSGKVFSPINGTVTLVAETGHAIGLLSDSGAEVLLHIGIDTVELGGKPFTAHVAAGDTVKVGQLLMDADLAAIKAAGKDTTTMMVITNTDAYASVEANTGADVTAGDTLVTVR